VEFDQAELERTASSYFGWEDFRPGQQEAVTAALQGRDVLAVMPTGHGKSAIYQLAAVQLEGPAVVVSPLIALQNDQMQDLNALGEKTRAVAINSTSSEREQEDHWDLLDAGQVKFLFLTPEQLAKDEVASRVAQARPALLVIDEAHCISSWGHDFRPDYLRLDTVREALGGPTIVALTATASSPVRDEIIERLKLRDPLVLAEGFDRPNLELSVQRHEAESRKQQAVLDQVTELPKPGLLYVSTRRSTEEYAAALAERGIRALPYHAGLAVRKREKAHEDFLAGNTDVVVATTAFGMGIDKPDVRFVVHADIPDSLDSYYQEIGRGGRDGERTDVVLHYRTEDVGLRTFFGTRHARPEDLRTVLEALDGCDKPMPLKDLKAAVKLSARAVTSTVNLLEGAGVLGVSRKGVRPYKRFDVDQGVQRAVDEAEARVRMEHSRIEMMRGYAETDGCRRDYLLRYFGESLPEPCGSCDNCRTGRTAASADTEDGGFPVQSGVRHREWGPGVVMSHEGDHMVVLFEQEGYKTLSRSAVIEHDLLTAVAASP
jgi:ATP-dependent DNA helicase RecQ